MSSREMSNGDGRRRNGRRGAHAPKTGPEWWSERWRRWVAEMDLVPTGGKGSEGRIKRLEVGLGRVSAVVQDRKQATCQLEIRLAPWSESQWQAALDAIGGQTVFATQFAAGELPIELDALLAEAGAPLLPTRANEVEIICQGAACAPGKCAHAAIVFTQLGEALTDDPWMLMRMRGRDQTQLLAGLRQPRPRNGESAPAPAVSASGPTSGRFHRNPGETGAHEDVPPLTAQIQNFWGASKELESYRPHLTEPKVEAVLLRRLGPLPDAASEEDIFDALAAVYRRVTREALRRAFAADAEHEK